MGSQLKSGSVSISAGDKPRTARAKRASRRAFTSASSSNSLCVRSIRSTMRRNITSSLIKSPRLARLDVAFIALATLSRTKPTDVFAAAATALPRAEVKRYELGGLWAREGVLKIDRRGRPLVVSDEPSLGSSLAAERASRAARASRTSSRNESPRVLIASKEAPRGAARPPSAVNGLPREKLTGFRLCENALAHSLKLPPDSKITPRRGSVPDTRHRCDTVSTMSELLATVSGAEVKVWRPDAQVWAFSQLHPLPRHKYPGFGHDQLS